MQAYLSTLRIWVVPLILVNLSWNVFVFFAERQAYAVTRRAYVTIAEVFMIASIVAYVKRATIFAIGSTKYALDKERVADSTFPQRIAFGNGFGENSDAEQTTNATIVAVIYGPMMNHRLDAARDRATDYAAHLLLGQATASGW